MRAPVASTWIVAGLVAASARAWTRPKRPRRTKEAASQRESGGRLRLFRRVPPALGFPSSTADVPEVMARSGAGVRPEQSAGGLERRREAATPSPRTFWTNAPHPRLNAEASETAEPPQVSRSVGRSCPRQGAFEARHTSRSMHPLRSASLPAHSRRARCGQVVSSAIHGFARLNEISRACRAAACRSARGANARRSRGSLEPPSSGARLTVALVRASTPPRATRRMLPSCCRRPFESRTHPANESPFFQSAPTDRRSGAPARAQRLGGLRTERSFTATVRTMPLSSTTTSRGTRPLVFLETWKALETACWCPAITGG